MQNLLHKLTSECEQIDNSRSENLTRLYDVEKSRDKLKTRLTNKPDTAQMNTPYTDAKSVTI